MHLVGFTTAPAAVAVESFSGLAAAVTLAAGVVSGRGGGVRSKDGLCPLISAGSLSFSLQFSFLLS